MEKTLKDEFRPTCYRLAASTSPPAGDSSPPKPKKKVPRTTFNKFRKDGFAPEVKKEVEKAPLRPTTTTFNLCNGVMKAATFGVALKECERTVRLFADMRDELLSSGVAKVAAPKMSVKERAKAMKSRRVSLAI